MSKNHRSTSSRRERRAELNRKPSPEALARLAQIKADREKENPKCPTNNPS